jgi:hypothetical protein
VSVLRDDDERAARVAMTVSVVAARWRRRPAHAPHVFDGPLYASRSRRGVAGAEAQRRP